MFKLGWTLKTETLRRRAKAPHGTTVISIIIRQLCNAQKCLPLFPSPSKRLH